MRADVLMQHHVHGAACQRPTAFDGLDRPLIMLVDFGACADWCSRAQSIAGIIAKARCAQAYEEDCYPEADDPLSIFATSIVRDLLAIAKTIAA